MVGSIMPLRKLSAFVSGLVLWLVSTAAFAADNIGRPTDWAIDMQPAASPMKARMIGFHDELLVIIIAITILVMALLAYVIVRFRAKANPTPSRTTHNTLIEVIWTVVPVIILVIIAVPSFKLLYYLDKAKNPQMTIDVTGHQWYWSYAYPDYGNFSFMSNLIQTKDLKPGQHRLLDVDNQLVLPINTDIRIYVESQDVIHSFFVPSLGVQMNAIPGRRNETWVRLDRTGVFYGECNFICGTNHSQMPIAVRGVTPAEFKTWVEAAKKKYADSSDGRHATVAVADASR